MKIEADTANIEGHLLGLCGRFDDVQEFQIPNGNVAKDELSFVQAWVLAGERCSGGKQTLITCFLFFFSLISLLS